MKEKKEKKGSSSHDRTDEILSAIGTVRADAGGLSTTVSTMSGQLLALKTDLATFKGGTDGKFTALQNAIHTHD